MEEKFKESEEVRKPEVVEESIWVAGEAVKKAPKMYGVPTGVEGLDHLFFTSEVQEGKVVKKLLGGIPAYSVTNITGVSDTGKTLIAEQYTIKQAERGEATAFITVEAPAPFVSVGLRERAKAMGVDFEKVQDKIVLIDAASHSKLRENIPDLLATLAYAIKNYKVRHVVIDSVTGLYEAREMLARTVVRQLFNFMKKWYQTAIFISQKRSGHEELTAEAAGGYAVSHIVDCSMVLSKELILTQAQSRIYKKPIGEMVRLFRIDGCRLCGHDTRTHFMEITELGLVKIGPALSGE
ncbi:putative circadian clock protein, KaiC [Hydrogenobacter thermophilus TK-6]|uniref:RecA-superfamily ATPase n=1 Tax=Hydrogenobacter thermophilus (strain DSM 6534 / IAM 12695 / TK-6) TaxID=608538 RepID=D3DHZ9_HYDTT|nr:KaiC domain-containing protein [Hydrogenobacter thermophilus]ADO45384.1 putative circadian clock protein, KaiC [Hydrogenobacter thermophilus TK-6]BAI69451.1 RecA-superfamily ATPase [Hydrogenobacter thermophilus TK-6]